MTAVYRYSKQKFHAAQIYKDKSDQLIYDPRKCQVKKGAGCYLMWPDIS